MVSQPRPGYRFVDKGEKLQDGDLIMKSSQKIGDILIGADCFCDGLFERKLDVVHSHTKAIKDYKPGDFYPPWWRKLQVGEVVLPTDWVIGHLGDDSKLGYSCMTGDGCSDGRSYVRPVVNNGMDECAYEGYRWVKMNEDILASDEYYNGVTKRWEYVNLSIGYKCTLSNTFRRNVEVFKGISEIREQARTIYDEAKPATEPVKRIEAIIKKAEEPRPIPTAPIETFNAQHSYCVSQGQFEGLVFSPIKLSRCGQWAWIHFNTRIHRKHVALVSETRTIKPYNINMVLESREDAREMAVRAERNNFARPSIWRRIKSIFK